MEFIQDILAAIGVVLNGIPQGLLALSYGFASVPTALGFAIGAVSCGVLSSVAPISFQAETIVMAGSMGKTRRDRLSMVMFGGLIMVVLGLTGALSAITAFAGDAIVHAMMAGVGFVLVRTAFNMVKENQLVGWVSVASAVVIYLITKALDPGNALVYTIVGSLIISSVAAKLAGQKLGENTVAERMCRLKLEKPVVNLSVIRGALSLACLTIGANIAFGNITSGMGAGELNVDHLTVYSGLADAVSSLFGGGPVEAIISATGAAPHAVLSGVIMMAVMALILFFGLLPKIGKFVPSQSIAGFLFILGAFVTIPGDGAAAFATGAAGRHHVCHRGVRPVLRHAGRHCAENDYRRHRPCAVSDQKFGKDVSYAGSIYPGGGRSHAPAAHYTDIGKPCHCKLCHSGRLRDCDKIRPAD